MPFNFNEIKNLTHTLPSSWVFHVENSLALPLPQNKSRCETQRDFFAALRVGMEMDAVQRFVFGSLDALPDVLWSLVQSYWFSVRIEAGVNLHTPSCC
jgi:hypothetical protein